VVLISLTVSGGVVEGPQGCQLPSWEDCDVGTYSAHS